MSGYSYRYRGKKTSTMPEKSGKRENKNEAKGEPKFLPGKSFDVLPEIPGDRRARPKRAAKRSGLGKMYDILPSIGPNVYTLEEFQRMFTENERQIEETTRECMLGSSSDNTFKDVGKRSQGLAEVSIKRSSSPHREAVKKRRMPKRSHIPDT
ncbi:uncharacterized protein LOC144622806 [Crassostrea virginica]